MQSTNLPGFILLFLLFSTFTQAQQQSIVRGTVTDRSGQPLYGATVIVKNYNKGTITNADGKFQLQGDFNNTITLETSFIGYKTTEQSFNTKQKDLNSIMIQLEESSFELDIINLTAKSRVQQVEELAYNVDVIDAIKLHNTTLDVGHALDRVSGIRVRESGGVGSQMNLSMNGFRGNQVKVFIDGIPMENFGSYFQLNNIPINLAERIEVYKGVVPIHLGADALGGAINIVTNSYNKDHLELSYSYGSFNTHRTNIDATLVNDNGLVFQMNAFQNYSDNDYNVTVDAANLTTGAYFPEARLRRFHDKYHNETFIGKVGVVDKSYADELLFGVTLGQNYNEVQTGARIQAVYGARHTRGNTVMPTFSFKKEDLFTPGLDVNINANYNLGKEKIIDTVGRRYNWFGEFVPQGRGELNYTYQEIQNNNGIGTLAADYEIDENNHLALSNVFTTFDRKSDNLLQARDEQYDQPQTTYKNVAGLSLSHEVNNFSVLGFAKNYNQVVRYSRSFDPAGPEDVAYENLDRKLNLFGYGAATTYFFTDNIQVKASYERSYRLPLPNELFGDANLLEAAIDLRPEKSDNYNLGATYQFSFANTHIINFEGNIFYRDADDFIRRRPATGGSTFVTENVAAVENLGFDTQIDYNFRNKLTASISGTYQNLKNNNPQSAAYRARIPNMPFLYGNANVGYNFENILSREDSFNLNYNLLYVHAFYLNWPLFGASDDKFGIPEQIAHDLSATYNVGHFQFTLECRNIFNEILYDNFSLQKPGRSFTGKIRYIL